LAAAMLNRVGSNAPPVRPGDALAIISLVAISILVALPGLGDGLLAYYDNPAHLAEIRDLTLVHGSGWSELAYCGFPLHSLQPPLTFGLLGLLTRLGVPLALSYQALIVTSYAAPSLAFWVIARGMLSAPAALFMASTILFYRPVLEAFEGMFSFSLSSAAWLLVLGLLAREEPRSLRHLVKVATLAAFIGLSHVYVTIALIYLGAVHTFWNLRDLAGRRRLYWDLPALGLGALSASAYWLMNALSGTRAVGNPAQLVRTLRQLVTANDPAPSPGANAVVQLLSDPVWFADAGLQLAILVAGAIGIALAFRGSRNLPKYGLVLAAVWLTCVAVQPWIPVMLLGPQNNRFVILTKFALLAGSIPAVAWVENRVPDLRRVWVTTLVLAVFSIFIFERLVAYMAVPETERREVEQMWQRLAQARQPDWGRVLVQDTFGAGLGRHLDNSHIMAESAQRAGIEQVGAYYGNTPYDREDFWLSFDPADPELPERTVDVMRRANATHLLLANPNLIGLFEADKHFSKLFEAGRFSLFNRVGSQSEWVRAVTPAQARPTVTRVAPGHIRIATNGAIEFTVAESYHRFWKAEPIGSAQITADAEGLIELRVAASTPQVRLDYTPPRLPGVLTTLGLVSILGLFVLDLGLKRTQSRDWSKPGN
jgi:hypothetical protein